MYNCFPFEEQSYQNFSKASNQSNKYTKNNDLPQRIIHNHSTKKLLQSKIPKIQIKNRKLQIMSTQFEKIGESNKNKSVFNQAKQQSQYTKNKKPSSKYQQRINQLNIYKQLKINKQNNIQSQNNPIKLRFKTYKKAQHLYLTAKPLQKNQRYFQLTQVKVPRQQIQRLGLLQASNIYKRSNVLDSLNKLKPEIYKKDISNLEYAKNSLFLTDFTKLKQAKNLMQNFIQRQLFPQIDYQTDTFQQIQGKSNYWKNQIHNQIQDNKEDNEKRIRIEEIQRNEMQQMQKYTKQGKAIYHLTILNYEIVKDENFYLFKCNHIEQWWNFVTISNELCKYLRKLKMSYLVVKGQKLINLWTGRKISSRAFDKVINIKSDKNKLTAYQIIYKAYVMWANCRKMKKIQQEANRQKSLVKWVLTRFRTVIEIGKRKAQKIGRALQLQQQLKENPVWDMQIHIPSFSESEFVKNTTQYMDYYQNCFQRMWKSTPKHFILVIPAVNQHLLETLQNRIKINRNVTIICPQFHPTFPKKMSLAGCLMLSYDALAKIRKATHGHKSIIIPYRCSNSNYQLFLSHYLNIPLFATLKMGLQNHISKDIFNTYGLPTPAFINVQSKCSFQKLTQLFASLIISNLAAKQWVFKLNGQLNGRGIATFNCSFPRDLSELFLIKSTRKIMQSNVTFLSNYLKQHLRIKLQVNCQHCLFKGNQYIDKFLDNGGIIQQFVPHCTTFQLCMQITNICSIQSCAQLYNVQYSTKLSKFTTGEAQSYQIPDAAIPYLETIKQSIFKHYFGYVSLTFLITKDQNQNGELYCLQIKPYISQFSNVYHLIHSISKFRQIISSGITQISYIQSINPVNTKRKAKNYYIYIPNLLFTDVSEDSKANIIQQIMNQCWNGKNNVLRLHESKVYLSLGINLSLLVFGSDIKKVRKGAIDNIRKLMEKANYEKCYGETQKTRDFFQYGDIIRGLAQIK